MNVKSNLLSGLRVIDCGTYIAGPAAATMMSGFGAEVIKIERPEGGDPYRYLSFLPGMAASEHNYCWLLDARNKKSLAVDLRDDAGREVLRKLVGSADVFITNYPPDLAAKFQVRYEDIEQLNPRLIYAQVTGYGETGDDTNKPGYDTTGYWARSGLTGIMFDLTTATGATPCGTGDHPVALALFGAIMLALYQRQVSGIGSRVSTSLMLVENSVKHVVAAHRDGGERVRIEVRDDGPGFTAGSIKAGHGLDNLQSRLAALFDDRGALEVSASSGQTTVIITLPYAAAATLASV